MINIHLLRILNGLTVTIFRGIGGFLREMPTVHATMFAMASNMVATTSVPLHTPTAAPST
jgi:hypothetical protein